MDQISNINKTSIGDEFQDVPINDQRLINRLIITATTLDKKPEKSIPDACQNWAETKATYNFFDNGKVTPAVILGPHRSNTIRRMKAYPLVLLVQDTSELDFKTHKNTVGLGPYSSDPNALGLLMHSVLAVVPAGLSLGLLYQNFWSRAGYPKQKKAKRNQLPIEEKESFKWLQALEESTKDIPNTIKTVTVADREADIFEFFQKAFELGEHLLVRATHNRRISGEYQLLYDQMNNIPEKGQCLVEIPRKSEEKLPRQAKLSVRFCPVTLCARLNRRQKSDLRLYAVLAREIEVLEGEEPIEWLLLTTVPVTNMSEAVQKIEWYRERWKIERFHYTLKSGCRIEDLQLETRERLINAITLYSIIAWRLVWLTYQSRVSPDLPCQIIFEEHEWQMLYCVVNQTKILPSRPPTLHEAVRLLAKLGGFLGRKHDGEPGVKVLWRGLQKLNEGLLFVEYFQLIQSISSPSHDVGNE
jgi:hypothetical protein